MQNFNTIYMETFHIDNDWFKIIYVESVLHLRS